MDNILNEKTLCRILQGRLRFSSGGPALYIYEPTKEILEESEAEEVLVEPLEKLKAEGKKAQSKGTVFLNKFIAFQEVDGVTTTPDKSYSLPKFNSVNSYARWDENLFKMMKKTPRKSRTNKQTGLRKE